MPLLISFLSLSRTQKTVCPKIPKIWDALNCPWPFSKRCRVRENDSGGPVGQTEAVPRDAEHAGKNSGQKTLECTFHVFESLLTFSLNHLLVLHIVVFILSGSIIVICK